MRSFCNLQTDFLILQSDAVRASTSETENNSEWQKTPYANLVRYKSSGIYFARFRVRGKLIRRSLRTSRISVAKLRLGDLEKQERQRGEHQAAIADGTMTCSTDSRHMFGLPAVGSEPRLSVKGKG